MKALADYPDVRTGQQYMAGDLPHPGNLTCARDPVKDAGKAEKRLGLAAKQLRRSGTARSATFGDTNCINVSSCLNRWASQAPDGSGFGATLVTNSATRDRSSSIDGISISRAT